MTTPFASVFYFLRNPRGGVEDLDRMKAAGCEAVTVNVGDHTEAEWSVIRERAYANGMGCWPWCRIDGDTPGNWYPQRLQRLIQIADFWKSPLIVNAEKGLDGTHLDITPQIAKMVGSREAALSAEAVPFSQTDWGPIAYMPALPQLNVESGHTDVQAVAGLWRAWGFKCVFPTFGTYGGRSPMHYNLQAPYNLYTADDCHNDYNAWKPTSTGYDGCLEDGGDVQKIGKDDGITAAINRLRDLDPGGTLLKKDAKGKWPAYETLPPDTSTWKAYDKLERTLTILKEGHDGAS